MLEANRQGIADPVHTTKSIMANAIRLNPALDSKEYWDFDAVHASGVLIVRSRVRSGQQSRGVPFLAQRSVRLRKEGPMLDKIPTNPSRPQPAADSFSLQRRRATGDTPRL